MKLIMIPVIILCMGTPFPSVGSPQERNEYQKFAALTQQEFQQWRAQRQREFRMFKLRVEREWGQFRGSTNVAYVEYEASMRHRGIVDFEKGTVRIEIRKDRVVASPSSSALKEAIESILLTRGTIDQIPTSDTSQVVSDAPILVNQVAGYEHPHYATDFAELLADSLPVHDSAGFLVIRFDLVPDHVRRRALPYVPIVKKYSTQFGLDPAHVMATIHTESWFNPCARSSANALGLMQVVPDKGGRDAYRYVHKKDGIPRAEYLFDPDSNIRLGCAYIHLLKNRHFGAVKDTMSKLYCSIAGYNTGPGNVAYAFTGERSLAPALVRINRIYPSIQVYEHLQRSLPYAETRQYVRQVVERLSLYRYEEVSR